MIPKSTAALSHPVNKAIYIAHKYEEAAPAYARDSNMDRDGARIVATIMKIKKAAL